jgi:hypothetical protein
MGPSSIIFIVLVVLIIAALPAWKYSKNWGGGYAPSIFISAMLAAHIYTIIFAK